MKNLLKIALFAAVIGVVGCAPDPWLVENVKGRYLIIRDKASDMPIFQMTLESVDLCRRVLDRLHRSAKSRKETMQCGEYDESENLRYRGSAGVGSEIRFDIAAPSLFRCAVEIDGIANIHPDMYVITPCRKE